MLFELEQSATARELAPTIAVRRAALVQTLRHYRDRGVFPHNYDFPGRAVPYFIDRRTGTRCAVAHLLEVTGRRDIVERVAATDNNVWVARLAGDTAFARWLGANGLTLAEASRIQVPYVEPQSAAEANRNTAFLAVAPVALGSAIVTGALNAFGNADGHRRATRIVGIASGLVSIAVGAGLATKSDVPRSVGMATAGIGGLSVALATRATKRHRAIVAQERETERTRAVRAAVSPFVGTGHGASGGVALSIRY